MALKLCWLIGMSLSCQLINPTIGATRTEEDFKNHIAQTLDTEPEAGWIFIVDQLNIHQSESLVRLVHPSKSN